MRTRRRLETVKQLGESMSGHNKYELVRAIIGSGGRIWKGREQVSVQERNDDSNTTCRHTFGLR